MPLFDAVAEACVGLSVSVFVVECALVSVIVAEGAELSDLEKNSVSDTEKEVKVVSVFVFDFVGSLENEFVFVAVKVAVMVLLCVSPRVCDIVT